MIQVGDRMPHTIRFISQTKGGAYESVKATLPCEVIYIHPSRRWCTLRVCLPNGTQFNTSEFLIPDEI